MSDSRVIITGGTGMVGSQADFGVKLSHKELDITDEESISRVFHTYSPEVVLHCAAYIDMAGCEENYEYARLVNVEGTKKIVAACNTYGSRLVFMSTGAVFDGSKDEPYSERDLPNPLNAYGKTKFDAENIVRLILPDSLIIRTGWLFGGGLNRDKKFVSTVFKKLSAGEIIKATSDRYGSPAQVKDVLNAIQGFMYSHEKGIRHVVNGGSPASYFDIACAVKEFGNFSGTVVPVSFLEMDVPGVYRGRMEALSSDRVSLRPWHDALKEYVTVLQS